MLPLASDWLWYLRIKMGPSDIATQGFADAAKSMLRHSWVCTYLNFVSGGLLDISGIFGSPVQSTLVRGDY